MAKASKQRKQQRKKYWETMEKEWICNRCGYITTTRRSMFQHIREIHGKGQFHFKGGEWPLMRSK